MIVYGWLWVFFFSIQSNNSQFLIDVFRPFIFSVNTDMVGFRHVILLGVFCLLSFSCLLGLLDYSNISCHYI